jgi:hypothetical protein
VLRFGKDPVTRGIGAIEAYQANISDRSGKVGIGIRVRYFFRAKKDGFKDEIFSVDLYPDEYTQPVLKQVSLVSEKGSLQQSQAQKPKIEKKYNSWMELLLDIEKKVVTSGEVSFDEMLSVSLMCISTELGSLNVTEADQKKGCHVLQQIIDLDILPFKPLFYLALEKERYDDAEIIRENWKGCLMVIQKNPNFLKYVSRNDLTLQRIKLQIKKLNIIGLTDPTLINLRKELASAITNKKWDEAQKIQAIITSRAEELRPKETPETQEIPQPKVVEKVVERPSPSSPTIIVQPPPQAIVQEPSEQRIQVENIPRYNATDVGRAISLMKGRGGRLTDKEAGTLQMFNILMGR